MKPDFNWSQIDTVLLDMDGTLLDLYFDNYFWQEYLPEHWGKLQGMQAEEARQLLKDWYEKEAGSLSWYCLDFWTDRLKFDVFALKADVEHLIQKRPHVDEFLKRLVDAGYRVVLVTNSHVKLIEMKMQKTGIDVYFEQIISSHQLGFAKEEQEFWHRLNEKLPFSLTTTLLVDDNLTVLRAAREYGIKNLLSIAEPDSRAGKQDTEEFTAIHSFNDLAF